MPKFLKRALLLLTAFAVLSVSLCACAGSTSTSSSEAVSAVSGEPSTGGSVTVGISQDLDSLDPHKAVNAGTSEVLFNIFEGLMKASPDGGVIPAVASDYVMSGWHILHLHPPGGRQIPQRKRRHHGGCPVFLKPLRRF